MHTATPHPVAELPTLVATIGHAMLRIRDIFAEPSELHFDTVHTEIETLEGFIAAKATIDAAFAYLADRDDAGRIVGAAHAGAYLKERLGLSPREAYDRLARGRDLYGEPEIPQPEPSPDAGDASDTSEPGDASEAAKAAKAAEAEEQRARARKAQEDAREHAQKVNAAKQEAIRQELDRLIKEALHHRMRLLNDALQEAPHRDIIDLRRLVRSWVDNVNQQARRASKNPNAGMEHRAVFPAKPRSDGNFDLHLVLTPADMALFKALTDKGLAPNSNLPEGVEDYRSPSQRRYDQFAAILRHAEHCLKPAPERGCASVVITTTVDELATADAETLFQTNTGIELSPFDLVRLGMNGTDGFILTIDGATNAALNLMRTRRTASIEQRIALLALHGVCAWAGCNVPLSECEAHHITAWIKGGDTDIGNLAPLCRHHHRRNNDNQTNLNNTAHIELDPATGQIGLRVHPERPIEPNSSTGAKQSAANKIRKHHPPDPPHPPPDSLDERAG